MNITEFISQSQNDPKLQEQLKGCTTVDAFLAFAKDQGHAFDSGEVVAAFEAADKAAGEELDESALDQVAGGTGPGVAFGRRG